MEGKREEKEKANANKTTYRATVDTSSLPPGPGPLADAIHPSLFPLPFHQAAIVWNGLLDLLYPPRCLVCGAMQEEALCALCRKDIRPLTPPFCDRCGLPVPASQLVCEACEAGPEPAFAWSHAMGHFTGTLRDAIHHLKYHGKTALARPLGELLSRSLNASSPIFPAEIPAGQPAFDLVVPVPLHPAKLRERGFNQAEKIARVLAQERGWLLDTRGLRRIQHTRSQTNLSFDRRLTNVQGAFAASEALYFAGRSVLLVDDVLTTRATMSECARVVSQAGARRVCVVALAWSV
jgi:competence protein ComFC